MQPDGIAVGITRKLCDGRPKATVACVNKATAEHASAVVFDGFCVYVFTATEIANDELDGGGVFRWLVRP